MESEVRDQIRPRVSFEQQVLVAAAGRASPINARSLNISAAGMFVCCKQPLSAGTHAEVRFELPDHGAVEAHARVVRQSIWSTELEPIGMALRFVNLAPTCATALQVFLNQQHRAAAGENVKLRVAGVDVTIRARAQGRRGAHYAVDAELPFLRVGSDVSLQGDALEQAVAGNISWVSVHVSPETGVPRLNIGIEAPTESLLVVESDQASRGDATLPSPPLCEVLDDESADDPVCTPEFVEHSRREDQRQRRSRVAS